MALSTAEEEFIACTEALLRTDLGIIDEITRQLRIASVDNALFIFMY